jgi:uncharacterized protein YebE (UPF0316 family)
VSRGAGQGYEGNVLVMFVVAPRRREHDVLVAVRHVDPDAFITVEPVNQAYGRISCHRRVAVAVRVEEVMRGVGETVFGK